MKDEPLIGQIPMTQFQSPNGEWSIFAILLAGIAAVGSGMLWLFRSREKENKERLDELKTENELLRKENEVIKSDIIELRHEASRCQEDRVLIHGQLSEMKLELARIRGS